MDDRAFHGCKSVVSRTRLDKHYSTSVEYYARKGALAMGKNRKSVVRRQPGRPSKDKPDGALLLLQAAYSSFANFGFRATTLRSIAAAAGVDPALAIHRFGSKEALWKAVIERQTDYLMPYIVKFKDLQSQTTLSIRARIETAFRLFVDAAFAEPECGLFLSRIVSERGEHLDMLVKMLMRPFYDAFAPLLLDAMEAKVIKKQGLELLYFMIVNAVTMSLSYRHMLRYFGAGPQPLDRLKEDMTEFLIVNFLVDHRSPAPRNGMRRCALS
jgi:TetR/AcrR family transcriptional regulator